MKIHHRVEKRTYFNTVTFFLRFDQLYIDPLGVGTVVKGDEIVGGQFQIDVAVRRIVKPENPPFGLLAYDQEYIEEENEKDCGKNDKKGFAHPDLFR